MAASSGIAHHVRKIRPSQSRFLNLTNTALKRSLQSPDPDQMWRSGDSHHACAAERRRHVHTDQNLRVVFLIQYRLSAMKN